MRSKSLASVFFIAISLLLLIILPGMALGADVLLFKTVNVGSDSVQVLQFENPGEVQITISSTGPVDVYVGPASKVGASPSQSDYLTYAEEKWTGGSFYNYSVSLDNKYADYYIAIFNDADSPVEVSVQVSDESGSISTPTMILCCCIPSVIAIIVFIVLIVFIIMAVGKLNKRTDGISQQAVSAQGGAPAMPPIGQPVVGQPSNFTWAQQIFVGDTFSVKMKLLHFGYSYFIYDAWNRQIGFCQMKAFKWKEDIRIFTDETKRFEIMTIKQEQVIDFSGSFQVWDTMSAQFLGILKRQGLKSILKDEWSLLNYNRQEVGHIKEDSTAMAVIRRLVPYGGWIPNASFINYQGRDIAVIKEKLKVIGNEYYIHMVPGTHTILDRRLAVACVLMMALFETRKNK